MLMSSGTKNETKQKLCYNNSAWCKTGSV